MYIKKEKKKIMIKSFNEFKRINEAVKLPTEGKTVQPKTKKELKSIITDFRLNKNSKMQVSVGKRWYNLITFTDDCPYGKYGYKTTGAVKHLILMYFSMMRML